MRTVRKSILVGAIFLLLFGTGHIFAEGMTPGALVDEAKKEILHVSIEVAKDLFDTGNYQFIDVREPNETKLGFIPGAIQIPRGLLEFRIGTQVPEKNTKMVVYCKAGGRSALATQSLKKLGYINAVSMDGGFTGWDEAGYPVDE